MAMTWFSVHTLRIESPVNGRCRPRKWTVFHEVPLAYTSFRSEYPSEGPRDARIVNLPPVSARSPPKVGADSVVLRHQSNFS